MPANPFILDSLPAKSSFTITPADGSGLDAAWGKPIRGIYVGGAGNIAYIGLDGVASDIPSAVAGSVLQIPMLRVSSTGTTATLLRGLV